MKFRQWLIQSIITLWSQSCFCHLNCQTCSKLSLLIPHPRLTTCFIISSLAAWISLFPAVCWQFVPVHALFPDLCPSFSLYTNKHGVDVVMLTLRADKCLLNWLCCSSTRGLKGAFERRAEFATVSVICVKADGAWLSEYPHSENFCVWKQLLVYK